MASDGGHTSARLTSSGLQETSAAPASRARQLHAFVRAARSASAELARGRLADEEIEILYEDSPAQHQEQVSANAGRGTALLLLPEYAAAFDSTRLSAGRVAPPRR